MDSVLPWPLSERLSSVEASRGASLTSAPGGNHASVCRSSASLEVDLSVHPSGIVPTLQNVVATCALGCPLDLKRIAQRARNAEYNPRRFAAVIMRIRQPKTTALIFSSGKMVCTGAKSEQESRLASRKFAKIVSKLGYKVVFQDFMIQNIVGSCDVEFPIRLEGLNIKHGLFSRYEPELFPGLIYKMKVPRVVLLVFVSGKVVLTGARTRKEIYQGFESIYPALTEFRKSRQKPTAAPPTSQPSYTSASFKAEHEPRSHGGNYSSPSVLQEFPSLPESLEESKSLTTLGYDDEAAILPDMFYPRSSLSSIGVAGGSEGLSGYLQRIPSTPHVSSRLPATPLPYFIPPPTPKTN